VSFRKCTADPAIRIELSHVSNVISMEERIGRMQSRLAAAVRDRRYAIRYPFAADAVLLDLESGQRSEGVTSDVSLGGCFICTSKMLPLKARTRVTLAYKNSTIEALAVVRIVKLRVGMGIEFLDMEPLHQGTLAGWIDQLRRSR
jgi:hypothetical protein